MIPAERTAVPVEWDEVKTQLMRLATELGPQGGARAVSGTSASRFIDSAANALGGNGEKLRETLAQLSGVARIFAEGSGNIVDIIKNLQIFVSALRDSKEQIVLFENRLATLTSVLNDNRSDLDAALTNLSTAIGEVQRFVAGSRNETAEQIQRLGNLTQVIVDNKMAFENVLHITPNAIANFNNIYYPNGGSVTGAFSLVNFSNPVQAHLRHDRRRREHHRTRDREAVRAVSRSGVAARSTSTASRSRATNTCGPQSIPTGSSTPIRSSRQAVRGPVIRPSRRRRCRPTPARATYRRLLAGTGRRTITGACTRLRSATTHRPLPSPAVINNAPPLLPPHIISNIPAQGSDGGGNAAPADRGATASGPERTAAACGRDTATMIRRTRRTGRRRLVRRADDDGLLVPGPELPAAARRGRPGL